VRAFQLLGLFAALLLGACAPTWQKPLKPEPAFTGPRLEADRFVSFDGARLGLTRWDAPRPWAIVVAVHGMNDYANAWHRIAPYWAEHGITTLAYDQRGFGRSPQRGVWGTDRLMTEDLRVITRLARRECRTCVIAVAGESMGAAVALEAFGSDRPPDADRLMLFSPAVWGWKSQPLINRWALMVAARLTPAKVYTPPRWLTNHISASDNIEELRAMGRDPLMVWGARSDTLLGLVNTMQKGADAAPRVHVPTLWMVGAHDQIVPLAAQKKALAKSNPEIRTAFYPDGWHLLTRDLEAPRVWADAAAFLQNVSGALPSGAAQLRP
jgi:acylglycerol lipase